MIAPNVIIPFDGTNAQAAALSGWAIDTRFYGKFPKGVTTGFGSTGGAATHTHTSSAHSHTDAHTHTFNTTQTGGTDGSHSGGASLVGAHSHSGTTGAVTSGSTDSVAATYGSCSNNPPYYEVIFIKSSGYNFIPTNGMVFHAGTRTGMTFHTASANKFLRGAGEGADAGGTGGSATNIHNIDHSHTATSHGHSSSNISSYANSPSYSYGGGDGGAWASNGHAHSVTYGSATSTINSSTIDLTTTETVEPSHCKIRHYKASTSTLPKPGDIAFTTETTPPVGWIVCDGNNSTPNMQNFYIKNVDGTFDNNSGNGFGSNAHTHAAQGHTHIGASHSSHTATIANSVETNQKSNLDPKNSLTAGTHNHSLNTMNAASSAYQSANTTANSSSNEPEYVKVQFIQYAYNPIGGGIMLT